MGLRDTAEQLDACKAQSVRDEAEIAEMRRILAEVGRLADDADEIRRETGGDYGAVPTPTLRRVIGPKQETR